MAFPFCNLKHLIRVLYNGNILIMGVFIIKKKKLKTQIYYFAKGIFSQENLVHQGFMKEFTPSGYSCNDFYKIIYNAPTLTFGIYK